jgi:4-alpha-glucanotransferase
MNADLRALRRIKGVSSSYVDGFGNKIKIPDDDIRDFLSKISSSKTFASERQRRWKQMVEPIIMAYEGATLKIVLRVNHADAISWNIREEGGKVHTGVLKRSNGVCERTAIINGESYHRVRFEIPNPCPLGYHDLRIGDSLSTLIVAPQRAFLSAALNGSKKRSGVALNLYRLRTESNWGVGDFGDLRRMAPLLAQINCDFIGLNPLSSCAIDGYENFSPYSPSSRHALDLIYLDPEQLLETFPAPLAAEFATSRECVQRIEQIKTAELIEFSQVANLKRELARYCFDYFISELANSEPPLAEDFEQFRAGMSQGLIEFISEESNGQQREFIEFVQWQLHRQLSRIRGILEESKFSIGLYLDFPLSASGDGAEVRANKSLYIDEATVGAPADYYNAAGQSWGFPPLMPDRLREVGFKPFISALRSTMIHCDMVRIDHILGFARLFCIPDGLEPHQGLYLRYPMTELLDILCLESVRNSCVVVGEDLGTVPDGFQKQLRDRNIFSYSMLFFSQDESGEYPSSSQFNEFSMLTSTTHDFPPLDGYVEGVDLAIRKRLNMLPGDGDFNSLIGMREADMELLKSRLVSEGIITKKQKSFSDSLIEFVKCSRSRLIAIPLEDLVGEKEPINIPGVSQGYPCWRIPMFFDWEYSLPDLSRG